jgi:hypothetical protein
MVMMMTTCAGLIFARTKLVEVERIKGLVV